MGAASKYLPIGYRSDLQGLRAIAVILVIIHHLNASWLSGGFVGVDVFFVLSGFLITSMLLSEYGDKGKISFSQFYVRRLRRLLPLLVVVLGVTSAFAFWALPKLDSREFLASLPFAATWTSNLFFLLKEKDYFNEVGDNDFYLHTWSLGVEEQFYLLWPLLIYLLLKAVPKVDFRVSLLVLVGLSFLGSLLWSYWSPISSFYMMPARIWQFSLGGLIYLLAADLSPAKCNALGRWPAVLFCVGCVAVLSSAIFLTRDVVYPGGWALIPSLGVAGIIFYGSCQQVSKNVTTKGLAHPVLVWLGDRSYSLYLWHWPVIVCFSYFLGDLSDSLRLSLSAILIILLLAVLSYRWVELPFWKKQFSVLPVRVFLLLSIMAVVLILAASYFMSRTPPGETGGSAGQLVSKIRNDLPEIYRMSCDTWYHDAKVEPCIFGSESAPNTVVLLADSIGAQWFSAIAKVYPSDAWRLIVLTKSACQIVDEDFFYSRIGKVYDVCRNWRRSALDEIEALSPSVVIIGSSSGYDFTRKQWVAGSARIVERLSAVAKQVVLISGTPALGFNGPSCIGNHLKDNQLPEDACIGGKSVEKVKEVAGYLQEVSDGFLNVQLFNPVDLVCPDGVCKAVSREGVPVFRDASHLTDTFVRSSVEYIGQSLPFNEGSR